MNPITLDAYHDQIHPALYRLKPGWGAPAIQIVVDSEEQDEITVAFREGRYEIPLHYRLLLDRISAGTRVLDLGTHIGTFALLAAAKGAEVLGIEASPRSAALLQHSAALNGFDRLHVEQCAAGDHDGELEFIQAGPYGLAASSEIDAPRIRVPLRALEPLVRARGWDRIDLIKMDVEGSEPAALRGLGSLLVGDEAPVILFESNGHTLHLAGSSPTALLSQVEQLGYRLYLADNGLLRPVASSTLAQGHCTVDYLATTGALGELPQGWAEGPSLTEEAMLARLLESCHSPNPIERAYGARTMATLDLAQRGSPLALNALAALRQDADPRVQRDSAWWNPPVAWTDERMALVAQLSERDAEVARLRALVEGYESGRVMRAVNVVNRFLRRFRN